MGQKIRLLVFLLLATGLIGCASRENKSDIEYTRYNSIINSKKYSENQKKSKSDKIPNFSSLKYKVAPGHLYGLYHPSDDKLRGSFRTNFDGFLYLPYKVKIKAVGMTYSELKNIVKNKYKKFFQRGVGNVRFTLKRKDYWVEVRGLVNKSGRYLVKRNDSIDKVIDQAGGLKGDLSKDFFMAAIQQQGKKYSISLNSFFKSNFYGKSPTWTGADSIFVTRLDEGDGGSSELPFVTVVGGVIKPGKTLFQKDASLFYYLSKTGGIISNVDYDESYLVRRTPKGLAKIRFDITKMNTIPAIYPNDVIFLNGEKKTFWDRFWERTLQVASLISTIAVLIIAL